jgi:lysophospholipase L1-like esterase
MDVTFETALALIDPVTGPTGGVRLQAGMRIAAIGDSITEAGGYLRAMEAVLDQRFGAMRIPPILNVGVSGHKAEDLAARFARDVLADGPDLVMISVGINDVWHRLDQPHDERVLASFAGHLEQMVTAAQDAGIEPMLLAPTVIEENGNSEGNRRLAQYVGAGREVAERNGCTYVDLHALFLAAIGSAASREGRLTDDGVHMLPLGDVLMAVGVLRALGVPDEDMVGTNLNGAFSAAQVM